MTPFIISVILTSSCVVMLLLTLVWSSFGKIVLVSCPFILQDY